MVVVWYAMVAFDWRWWGGDFGGLLEDKVVMPVRLGGGD